MNSIKDCGLPETDKNYLIFCPDYSQEPFEAYLDDNYQWWDVKIPKSGIAFIFYEVVSYKEI